MTIVDSSSPDRLIDAIINDLTFMTEKIGIQVTVSLKDQYLIITQEAIDKTTRLYFMDFVSKNQIIFSYKEKSYLYHSGMLQEAAEKAKKEKDEQIKNDTEQQQRKHNSVINAVMKIIKINRNEESDDEN